MPTENAGLSKGFVEEQRKRLEALREQLLTSSAVAAERDRQDVTASGPLDASDLGEIATERETDDALHDLAEKRLRAVERALEKMAEGTYGLSDASGKPIPKERLEKAPEAIDTIEEERARESGSQYGSLSSGERAPEPNVKRRKTA
jgi:RNA polymerase-binding transcription factor